jgi:hypothetical protein
MTTPAWLQAAALLLWGFASGQQALAALLAVARLLAAASGVRLTLSDRDLNRAVDLSALAVLLTGAGFLLVQGLPQGLLAGTGWLPAALFPLLLVDALSATPLRLRHLALTLRRSAHAQADRLANLGAPYLAMTLLAASVLARPSPWFFWALASVLVLWLYAARPAPRTPALAAFVLAALVAIAVAYGVGAGLQRTQLALQEWGIDALSDTDPDPYHSQTRIGDLGRVKRSERILWRVEQAPPAVAPLLLRNGVFSRYANGAWLARRDSFTPLPPAPASGQAWLTLHGQSRQGIAIVPIPIGAEPVGNDPGMLQRNAYGIIRAEAAPPLLDVVVARAPLAASTQPRGRRPVAAARFCRTAAAPAGAGGAGARQRAGTADGSAGLVRRTLPLHPVPGRRAARRTRPRTLPAHRSRRPLRIFRQRDRAAAARPGHPGALCHRLFGAGVQPTRSGLRGASATRARLGRGLCRWPLGRGRYDTLDLADGRGGCGSVLAAAGGSAVFCLAAFRRVAARCRRIGVSGNDPGTRRAAGGTAGVAGAATRTAATEIRRGWHRRRAGRTRPARRCVRSGRSNRSLRSSGSGVTWANPRERGWRGLTAKAARFSAGRG